jgi:hypothetical protein
MSVRKTLAMVNGDGGGARLDATLCWLPSAAQAIGTPIGDRA